jgi:hypothetical protein
MSRGGIAYLRHWCQPHKDETLSSIAFHWTHALDACRGAPCSRWGQMGSKARKTGCASYNCSTHEFRVRKGRWDRNRTCNLRFWSTRRAVQDRLKSSNAALNPQFLTVHRPGSSKNVQPVCSQFCSQVQHGERFKATGRSNVTWMPLWRAGHRDFARSNDVPYVWNQLSWLVHTVAPVH